MNELQTFTYNNSQVRMVEKNGEPWWVLKDVCEVLNIENHKDLPKRLEDDEVGRLKLPHPQSPNKTVEMLCINESGLYNVILRSDKPEAKPFRKWVTSEVLPSIRRTGAYSTPTKPNKALEIKEMKPNPRHEQLRLTLGAMGYRYFAKTWRGVPVITMNDFAYFTGIIPDTARCFVEKYCKRNTEYYLLKRAELAEFRLENPEIGRKYGSLVVMTKSAVDKLVSYYGCADNAPPMIEEKRALPTAEAEPVTANRKPRCVTTDDAIVALEVLRYVKEHNESCKRYDHVAAIEKVIKDVGMLIAAGY